MGGNENDGYGVLGPKTKSIINTVLQSTTSYNNNVATQVVTSSSSLSQIKKVQFMRVLARGMEGDDVYSLQTYLATDPALFTFAPNGYFGPATETAVKRFQLKYGVITSVDVSSGYGIFGKKTQAKFYEVFK